MTIPDDMRAHNRTVINEFRANGGPGEGRPLLLLTTTGARTGLARTTPMMYLRARRRLLVIASNAGAPSHPDWYRNLVANPEVTVELGSETFPATAEVMEGKERERLWAEITARYPFFITHQEQVDRIIPVVALKRRT